jgi:hypothetical protein
MAAQAPAPQAPKARAAWGGSQAAVFALQIIYLTLLAVLAILYFTDRSALSVPDSFGSVSVGVPWFGALGAVLISLTGTVEHRGDWDPSYRFWHWSRPLLGASLGIVSVLIFQAGILAVGSTPTVNVANVPRNLLYYLVAFLVGYREETFRALIKRLTDIVLSPGTKGKPPTVTSMAPKTGPAAGGTEVTVLGSDLSGTDSARFGLVPVKFRVDGDSQLTLTSAPGSAGTAVNVVITTKDGSAIGGTFTYGD